MTLTELEDLHSNLKNMSTFDFEAWYESVAGNQSEWYDEGYREGKEVGYDEGYEVGYADGADD